MSSVKKVKNVQNIQTVELDKSWINMGLTFSWPFLRSVFINLQQDRKENNANMMLT